MQPPFPSPMAPTPNVADITRIVDDAEGMISECIGEVVGYVQACESNSYLALGIARSAVEKEINKKFNSALRKQLSVVNAATKYANNLVDNAIETHETFARSLPPVPWQLF